LNPALYTIAGPYGQDAVAATYVARRLPGLRVALEGLAAAGGDPEAAGAWLTLAMRERNRVWDALVGAFTALVTDASQAHTNPNEEGDDKRADAAVIP
jgi:hypothetical protein